MELSQRVQEILRDLHSISGFRISLHDAMFRELLAFPKHPSAVCACVQRSVEGKRVCVETDRKAFQEASATGGMAVYRCLFGLWEVVCPLYRHGVLSGYLMMGQALPDELGAAERTALACRPYCEGGRVLGLDQLPVFSEEQVKSFARIMTVCAEYLTLSGAIPAGGDLAKRVEEYLRAHYAERITLLGLAEIFRVSRSTLIAAFDRAFGKSIMSVLFAIRMEQAERLLRESSLSVAEISARCGFTDQGYFARIFRKKFGIAPSCYRMRREEGLTLQSDSK